MCTRKNSEIFVTRGRSQLSSPCNVSMYPLPRLELLLDFGIDCSWTISIPLFHRHIQGTGLLQVLCIFQLNSVLVHFRCVESYIRFFMLIQLAASADFFSRYCRKDVSLIRLLYACTKTWRPPAFIESSATVRMHKGMASTSILRNSMHLRRLTRSQGRRVSRERTLRRFFYTRIFYVGLSH